MGALAFFGYEILLRLKGLVLVPLLTATQPLETYGLYVQAMVLVALGAAVAGFHFHVGLLRFIPSSRSSEERSATFRTFSALLLLSSVLFAPLVCVLGAAINPALVEYLPWLGLVILGETWLQFLSGYYWAVERLVVFAATNALVVIGDLCTVAALTLSGHGLAEFLFGLLIVRAIACLWLILRLAPVVGFGPLNTTRAQSFIRFSASLLFSAMALWAVDASDRLVIGAILGDAWAGAYNPAYMLGGLVAVAARVLVTPLAPMAARLHDSGQSDRLGEVVSGAWRVLVAVAVPYVFLMLMVDHQILSLLATGEIAQRARGIAPIVGVGAALFAGAVVFQEVLKVYQRTGFLVKVWAGAALLNVGLNIELVPLLGILGAAVSTVVAFGVAFVLIYGAARRHIAAGFTGAQIWRCAAAGIPLLILFLIVRPSNILGVALVTAAGLTVYVVCLVRMGMAEILKLRMLVATEQAPGSCSAAFSRRTAPGHRGSPC